MLWQASPRGRSTERFPTEFVQYRPCPGSEKDRLPPSRTQDKRATSKFVAAQTPSPIPHRCLRPRSSATEETGLRKLRIPPAGLAPLPSLCVHVKPLPLDPSKCPRATQPRRHRRTRQRETCSEPTTEREIASRNASSSASRVAPHRLANQCLHQSEQDSTESRQEVGSMLRRMRDRAAIKFNGRVDRGRAKDQPFENDAFEASASNPLLRTLS